MTAKTEMAAGFLRLDHEFIRSERVTTLSAKGKALLLGMADRFNGRNNSQIPFSRDEAVKWLHCSPATAKRTFNELKDAGLIAVVKSGSFALNAGERKGSATIWRLTFIGKHEPTEPNE